MPVDSKRVQVVFLAAVEAADPAARVAVLDRECGTAAELRLRVEALLLAHDAPASLLDGPAFDQIAACLFQRDEDTSALVGNDEGTNLGAEPRKGYDPMETQDELAATKGEQPVLDLLQPSSRPGSLGRLAHFEVEGVLGEGGFGTVLKAFDEKLQRAVAIKVPHPGLLSRLPDAEAYLTEARTVASLDHPNIVPVFEVGSSAACPCFIVSKLIEGSTLAQRIKDNRPSFGEATELTASIAEALHYAHRRGLVHRDVKPGNILIDSNGNPFLVDFGLALREEHFGQGPKNAAGTLAYMSPEQARGEGHRVDGRSDIFSLGVVLYELLVGRQPFRADSQLELMEQITSLEPRPPRQLDDALPKELERICLKAMAKRAVERYTTARDLADDLRHWQHEDRGSKTEDRRPKTEDRGPPVNPRSSILDPRPSDSQPVKIVPKGLRSFDAHDADFFLELLPGPRDRDGLPDSLRFWKSRIEETDPDNTFAVGLIYGPSGCGKSSLVKAGLLPRLSDAVLAVYIEATAHETETRLLNGLRKRCPAVPANLSVKETLAALRRGQGVPAGKKVLIVLDQFEQWLHARRAEENTELVQALRQCDGGRVQGIVMVRDDFWLAVSRFLRELEFRLLEGQNSALVDLFDADHAKRVLAACGRAFGKLPENTPTKEQREFLRQAIHGLAQEGKIICVRLALFAEMMKGKSWTVASLKEMGGTEGVGVTFLEETFSAATAPPEHRYHQSAARAVLRALLPESGTDIKGHMRSHAELLAASGYGNRPRDFEALIGILDGEIRLITPTDPEGLQIEDCRLPIESQADGTSCTTAPPQSAICNLPSAMYYQLTHDYLVHPLRDWLTRKQKETRRGRAELLLADRAGVWNARRENRQLPSLPQWASIRLLTLKKTWTPPQRTMMRQATRYHALRGLLAAALLALIGGGSYAAHGTLQAQALRDRLLDANTSEVPTIVRDMAPYRRWLDPLLRAASQDAEANQDTRKQLHASLALLPVDSGQQAYLYHRLLDAAAHEVPVLRDALAQHKDDLLDNLWTVVEQPARGQEQKRLRAACALATYDPRGQRWEKARNPVVDQLVAESPVFLGLWMEGFRPVGGQLMAPLANIFRDAKRRESERSLATSVLADYAADQPHVLADLLMDADEKSFAVLYPKLKEHGERGLPLLLAEVDQKLPADAGEDAKEKLAKRQANAAVALLRLDRSEKVWPLLKHGPDPRTRSYLIQRLAPLGADVGILVKRLEEEHDLTIRRALVLSIGDFGENELGSNKRTLLVGKVREIYSTAADPGLHGAAEWLLRHWNDQQWLKQQEREWAGSKVKGEGWWVGGKSKVEGDGWSVEGKSKSVSPPATRHPPPATRHPPPACWYVNSQGQTMVVIPGPVEFLMGSPATEPARDSGEVLHHRRIDRTFAASSTQVTVEQFQRFDPQFGHSLMRRCPEPDCPIVGVTWYEAAAYCNWLSKQDGLPEAEWCYQPNPEGEYAEGMKLTEDYLKRTGYRLPTEAEWEFACRAGMLTSRYFGQSDDLLDRYAWYTQNSNERTWPVGSLRPNDLGLFDMHGHLYMWCQEKETSYPREAEGKVTADKEDSLPVNDRESRELRGGSFNTTGPNVRSALRYRYPPPEPRHYLVGFRLARTFR